MGIFPHERKERILKEGIMLKRIENTRVMPKHLRINWKSSERRAKDDKEIFKKWMDGLISTERAIARLSSGNGTVINEKEFIANAEWLGYMPLGDER